MKWICKLYVPASGLWATWVKLYIMKQESIWSVTSKDHFPSSIKDILKVRDTQPTPVGDWVTCLAYSGILPSHRIISFMAIQGQLATVDNLQKRGFSLANRCCPCESQEELHELLFFSCTFSHQVWSSILNWMHIDRPSSTLQHELSSLAATQMDRWRNHWFKVSVAAVVHFLWTERINNIFSQTQHSLSVLISSIKFQVSVRMLMRHHEYFLAGLHPV
ncbi:uncharacterized protein LOC141629528 [Silene latifolia]|uniref:uncharacterized protein LOC141629528 n=1 Tax=Silene latifolia TaxID=37657 RepID=UPI003D76E4C4